MAKSAHVRPLIRPEIVLHQGMIGGEVSLEPIEKEEHVVIQDDEFQEGEEDTEKLKVKKDIIAPSASEIEEHRLTHHPFRSWCRECVEGRALGERRVCHPKDRVRRIPSNA